MPITRTPMIDDDGSGTTGTIINNAWKQEFYNQIDDVIVTVGAWVDIAFNAANFSAPSPMMWTVASGDQVTFGYALAGRLATVLVNLSATTVGGTLSAAPLQIGLPITPQRNTDVIWWAADVGGSFLIRGRVIASDPSIYLYRVDGTSWKAGTDATSLSGQVALRV
jgi:hypothetical protein